MMRLDRKTILLIACALGGTAIHRVGALCSLHAGVSKERDLLTADKEKRPSDWPASMSRGSYKESLESRGERSKSFSYFSTSGSCDPNLLL